MICPVHNVETKTVPAGVSKSTGRPYNAFEACPVQGCTWRPPKANNGGGFQKKDGTAIAIQVALKAAVEFFQGKPATTAEVLKAADEFANWIDGRLKSTAAPAAPTATPQNYQPPMGQFQQTGYGAGTPVDDPFIG